MYVRVKTTPNSPRKSVQIVESIRQGETVKQVIVRHVGIALNDEELLELKRLAEGIRVRLEDARSQNLPLFPPESRMRKVEGQASQSKKPVHNLETVVFFFFS